MYLHEAISTHLRKHLTTGDLSGGNADWEQLGPFFGRHAVMLLDAYAELGLKAFAEEQDGYLDFLHSSVIRGLIGQILPARSVYEEEFTEQFVEGGFGGPDGDWEVTLTECWRTLTAEKHFDANLKRQWNYDVRWKLRVHEHRGPFRLRIRTDLEERSLYWEIRCHEAGTSSTTPLPRYPSLLAPKTLERKATSTPSAEVESEEVPTEEPTADGTRKSTYTYSENDGKLHDCIVELNPYAFGQLSNSEIEKRYRRTAEGVLSRKFPKDESGFRNALKRIRHKHDYPSAKQIGTSKNKSGQS